jgi:CDP-glucose 4,6-dehydratase
MTRNLQSLQPSFWRGKRVLLTGHTGFKGSWLAVWLQQMGSTVFGFALPPNTEPSLFTALGLERMLNHEVGDVRNANELNAAVRRAHPDILIHLAAQSIVSAGYDDPLRTFDTNIMGTANLLQACRLLKPDAAILVVSSDKCYLNQALGRPFREDDPLGGCDPYSASKAGTEIVTTAFRVSFFSSPDTPRVASARAGNVIGGGDWSADRLMPDLMRAFSSGRPAIIRNPRSTRPWQHVLEPLYGYLLLIQALAENRNFARAWNFGSGAAHAVAVSRIVDLAVTAWGGGAHSIIASEAPRFEEAESLVLDSSDALNLLGWAPSYNIESVVQLTVDWYRRFYEGGDRSQLTEAISQQIDDYVAHAPPKVSEFRATQHSHHSASSISPSRR